MISKKICTLYLLCLFSPLNANISSIENNFNYYLFVLNQDSTFIDSTLDTSDFNKSDEKFRSPVKAMLMSGLLPGMGQVYLGHWKRGIVYGVIEAIAIGTWYRYNNDFKNSKQRYQTYANENWSFALWMKDFYQL